ncbi:MAG: DUF3352 domain-containing protein [Gaiellaceae bacterium]
MRKRELVVLVIALLGLAVAGCGGDGGGGGAATGTESAATIAPATAALYLSLDTDFESDQWDGLNGVLDRFPGKQQLIEMIRQQLSQETVDFERDVKPALGPTVELIALDFKDENNVVGLTKPQDEQKLRELVANADDDDVVLREIEGWTAVADNEAVLDRLEQAADGDSLADSERFTTAMEQLPEEALAKLYLNGERATEGMSALETGTPIRIPERFGRLVSFALALEAEEDGVRFAGFTRLEGLQVDVPEMGALLEQVPADAYAFVNFHGYDGQVRVTDFLRDTPEIQPFLGQAERFLGVTLDDVTTLFNQEGIVYARPGALIPEITLMLEVDDEEQALRTVDRLAQRAAGLGAAPPRSRSIGDVQAKELSFGQFSLLYAAFDGRLVVTTQADGIAELDAGGDKLVDGDRYGDAVEAAGVEDDEDVYFYFDLQKTVDIAEQLAQLAEQELPSEARANLEPLRSLVASAKIGKENTTFRLFVEVE